MAAESGKMRHYQGARGVDENHTAAILSGTRMTEPSTRMYRSMVPNDRTPARPSVGRSARELGVRVGVDVHPDESGNVGPNGEGMSVSRSLATLPDHRCPRRLRALHPGASGNDADRVFRLGYGAFVRGAVAAGLRLRPDDKPAPGHGTVTHGVVEPAKSVPLGDYERDLAATQEPWDVDESGSP